jgi:hypothetical protein
MSVSKFHFTLASATILLASASAVWAAEDNYYIHFTESPTTAGYITAGDPDDPALPPPAGACGMRFESIDDWEWILPYDLDEPSIPSGPLNIYIGLADCGWDGVTIEPDLPGSGPEQIVPLQGFAGSLRVYAAGYWIDSNGERIYRGSCGGCVPDLPEAYGGSGSHWLVLPGRLTALKSALSGKAGVRSVDRLFKLIDGDLTSLSNTLSNGIARRRTTPLGVLDASVRVLEDNAQRRLAFAVRQTNDCRNFRVRGDFKSAVMACDAASASVDLARVLLSSAESWFK